MADGNNVWASSTNYFHSYLTVTESSRGNGSVTYHITSGVWTKYRYNVSTCTDSLVVTDQGTRGGSTTMQGTGTMEHYNIDLTFTRARADAYKTATYSFTNNSSYGKGTSTVTVGFTVPGKTPHTYSYNANGGEGAPGNQTVYWGEHKYLPTTLPSRNGFEFITWNTKQDGTGTDYAPGSECTDDLDITFYAQWRELTYTVSFDANGGEGAPEAQTKSYTTALTLTEGKPTRDRYDFLGWATSKDAAEAVYQPGAEFTANADTVLHAVWKLAWVAPTIANITCYRSLADGTASDEGTCASVSFDWSTFSELYPSTRVWASCNGTEIEGEAGGLSGSFAGMFGGLDLETTYTVTMSVSDTNGTNTRTATVQPMDFLIDFAPGGGVGIGGIAPNGARRLSVQMDGMELANPDTDDLLIAADTAANTYQLGTASGMSLAGSPTALTVTDGGSQVAGLTAAKATLDTADGLAMAGGRTIADSDGLCVPYCKTLYVQESGHGGGYEPSFDPTPYDMIEVFYRYGGGVDKAYAYGSPQFGSVRLVLDDPGLPIHFTLQGMFQATSETWQLLCEKKILTSEGIRNNGYGKFINSGSSEVKAGSNSECSFTILRVVGWTWA